MAILTDQDKQFIQNLKSKGYSKEDAFTALTKVKQAKGDKTFTFGERFMQNLKAAPAAIFGENSLTGQTIGKIPLLKNVSKAIEEGSSSAIAGVEQAGTGVKDIATSFQAPTLSEGVTQASKGVAEVIGGGLGTAFAAPVAAAENLPIVGGAIEKVFGGISEGVNTVATAVGDSIGETPEEKEALRLHINNLVTLLGVKYGPKAAESVVETLKPYATKTLEGVKADFPNATQTVSNLGDKFQEGFQRGQEGGFKEITGGGIAPKLSQKLIASTDKIDPTKTVKFEQMTKVKPAQWLQERGIVAAPEEAVAQLTDYWKSSKDAVDTTLAKVEGRFQDKSVSKILEDQKKYFSNTADRANLNLTKKRIETLESEGLTLSEINSIKRLYESTEKLGYAKDLNSSTKVARSTNLDSDIREFLIDTAEQRGFKNIRELNKETQAAKFLADEIYKKMQKQESNNVLGLTDQIMAMGGVIHPSAWAALGLKKIILGETGKTYLAKLLSPEATKGIPAPTTKLVELKSKQKKLQESQSSNATQTNMNPNIESTNPISPTISEPTGKSNFNKAGTAENANLKNPAKSGIIEGMETPKENYSYRIQHQITDGVPANNITNLSEIVKEHKAKNGYLTNYDLSDLKKLEKMQGNPDMEIKIYRASPVEELNNGDWVTTSKVYASDIKKQNGGKVYEYTVKAKELLYPKKIDELPSLARFSAFKYIQQ